LKRCKFVANVHIGLIHVMFTAQHR